MYETSLNQSMLFSKFRRCQLKQTEPDSVVVGGFSHAQGIRDGVANEPLIEG